MIKSVCLSQEMGERERERKRQLRTARERLAHNLEDLSIWTHHRSRTMAPSMWTTSRWVRSNVRFIAEKMTIFQAYKARLQFTLNRCYLLKTNSQAILKILRTLSVNYEDCYEERAYFNIFDPDANPD